MMRRAVLSAMLLAATMSSDCAGPSGEEAGEQGAFVRVSPRDNRYLELTNGAPFVPVGLNIAFPRFLYEDDAVLEKMEERMRKLSANGGNLVRIWMGHEFYEVEHARYGEYDEGRLRRLDRVIEFAKKYGIRVKLTFGHFRSLEDTPPAFHGAARMGNIIYRVTRGGPAVDMSDFFQGERGRAGFKEKIAWFADRYRAETAVFAWELWDGINEVQGEGWEDWTEEMLAELHRQFPRHLAVQGVGSLSLFPQRSLFARIWEMPGNDIAQVHRDLDQGAPLDICRGPMDLLAADAVREVAQHNYGKPILLAECGAVEDGQKGPSKLYERDRFGILLHDMLFAPFFAGAAGPGQPWHWDFYIEKHDLWRHFGGFAGAIDGIDPPAENFETGMMEHPRLRIYTLRGQKTFLAWCRDSETDWRTELVEDRGGVISDSVIDLNGLEGGAPAGTVRTYNPWIAKWTPATLDGGKLVLPKFLRSILVRIDG